jgi:starch synthase
MGKLLRLELPRSCIKIPTLLTIHNAEYQGIFSKDEIYILNDIDYKNRDKRKKTFNSLELGIKFCNALNTVSPNYAKELLKKEKLSFGLNKTLIAHQDKFSGIINGADYSIWDPKTDSLISEHYSSKKFSGKSRNKRLLLKECNWKYSSQPVIGMVSRLVTTKGFRLLIRAMDEILKTGVKLVILGTGDVKIVKSLNKLVQIHPNQISFHNYFDEKMAHLIEAGSDIFLMPSRYEPCGLNQIYSLRYGTVPIVFNTGGLADTVTNYSKTGGNGFIFNRFATKELVKTVQEAVRIFQDKKLWKKLVINGMKVDYSWSNSAEKYLNLYTQILEEK